MNGSEINKILNGLYAGGTGIAAGLIDKADKNKPKDLYEKESAYLKSTYQGAIENANKILNPGTTTGGATTQGDNYNPATGELMPDQPPVQDNTIKPTAPTAPNINDLYARREKAIMDLSGMKYGAPYAESLNRLYKDTLDPQSDWEIKEGKDGQFFAINKKTFDVKKITEPTEKPKEFSTKNWDIFLDESGNPYYGERVQKDGKVQIEFRDNLNKKELDDWNYDNQLKEKKLAPPTRTSSNRGPKTKEPMTLTESSLKSKVTEYSNLKLKSGELSAEEEDKFNNLKSEIEKITGKNADDITDKLANSEDLNTDIQEIVDEQKNNIEQEKNASNELKKIKDQYASGKYDKADLEKNVWDWLGSLFNTGISQEFLDSLYKDFEGFLSLQNAGLEDYIEP